MRNCTWNSVDDRAHSRPNVRTIESSKSLDRDSHIDRSTCIVRRTRSIRASRRDKLVQSSTTLRPRAHTLRLLKCVSLRCAAQILVRILFSIAWNGSDGGKKLSNPRWPATVFTLNLSLHFYLFAYLFIHLFYFHVVVRRNVPSRMNELR